MTKNPTTVMMWVSRQMDIPIDVILSKSRSQRIVLARAQIAKILHNNMGFSYPEIGKFLERDQASIRNLVKEIESIFTEEEIFDIRD